MCQTGQNLNTSHHVTWRIAVQGHSPLHWAALNNRTAEVELLIAVRTRALQQALLPSCCFLKSLVQHAHRVYILVSCVSS